MDKNIQAAFFHHLKQQMPPHLSLVNELSELLNISSDSAYRRIRGEKAIDFDELKRVASHYKVSIDQFLHLEPNRLIFTDRTLEANSSFQFSTYLKTIIEDLSFMNSFDDKMIFYLNKDVPVFHHFSSPELAAFKSFFWRKTILQDPAFAKQNFEVEKYALLFAEAAKKIHTLYTQIPSVEIWNVESINSTIRQIDYYKDTQVFLLKQDVITIYQRLLNAIELIEQYAETGKKASAYDPHLKGASYEVYINEFILGDNTLLVQLDGSKVAYINHAVHNYIMTKDERFCDFTYNHFQNIIKRSTPISNVNEKDRKKFFNKMKDKIKNRLDD